MRLSIISLVGEDATYVDTFLYSLKEQETQSFEIILCINKNSEAKNIFNVAKKYYEFFGSRLVIITNSKDNSYQHNLVSAFRIIKGDYVTVINSDSSIKKYFIGDIIEQAQRFNVDVLEFKPRLVGTIRFKPKERTELDKILDISKNPNIIAYTYPFIFNKVFKKSLVKKITKYKPRITNDSIVCLELNYLLLMEAKKYKYLDFRIIRQYIPSDTWFNSKVLLDSFNVVDDNAKRLELKIQEELKYAKYYFIKLLLTGFLSETYFVYRHFSKNDKEQLEEKRSKILIQKHDELLKKIESSEEFQTFLRTNIYMMVDSPETQMLREDYKKLVKTKILDNLE
ncbi:glycosyltransferase [Mycoplasmopsis verecunda]|uniref:Glycosyl transferase family 2 n=1 Tax=Mycoplasmopsis verecunda TaxID=171291 RepID=A0A1T4KLR0_9BACT|nr:glycosyltransferase family 2 protein [Mycoplasmopsis verecunda]WPB54287.1 glycosyltransferase family 2 protein [Mycoplasmopsis verecunda]SJZ43318.1 Glycosyl transferase family 2 [Mycoplasmopsis verecunda]